MDPTYVEVGYPKRYPRLLGYIFLLFFVMSCNSGSECGADRPRELYGSIPTYPTTKPLVKPKSRIMEPAFADAGKTAGIQIWRIENFKPVAYPKSDYGKFYTGDSYIILHTKERKGVFSWDIHFWLGKETSQDEAGAAAILSVQLDDQLGGGPVQYREVQNHESQEFLSLFKNGVRYAPGGIASGFTQVDRNAFETRLFQVKGKKNVRVKQVTPSISSMNKGDCFILDVGKTIYVYVGSGSKRVERLKAISAANDIRDQDHSGRGSVIIIDESATQSEIDAFFEAIGGGSPDDVPDESVAGSDDEFEIDEDRTVSLYKISDQTGSVQVTPIGSTPLKQAYLDTNDCFVLDTGAAHIYVWVGKKCTANEKSQAMRKAEQFISTKNYPTWTRVQRVVEGAESSAFKQYFQGWKGPNEQYSRLIRSADGDREPSRLEIKNSGDVPDYMPDDGSGIVEIYRVEDFELVPVDPENYGKFFGGDSYIIKYSYGGNKHIIYIWQGNQSSIDEKAASAIHAIKMDNDLNGAATQIRVVQGHEPKHFLHIFQGKLIIFLGGHASGFKNIRDHDTYTANGTKMYRVRGTSDVDVRAVEMVANATSLEGDDVFIVENGTDGWIWLGHGSEEIEKELAQGFFDILAPDVSADVISEGEEPEEFWDALGGKDVYKSSYEEELLPLSTTLFHAKLQGNKLVLEEIKDFGQQDLVEDDIMILDAVDVLFVWVGKDASTVEKELSFEVVQKYLKQKNREDTVVMFIKQEEEPESFTLLFPSWDTEFWSGVETYASIRRRYQNSLNTVG